MTTRHRAPCPRFTSISRCLFYLAAVGESGGRQGAPLFVGVGERAGFYHQRLQICVQGEGHTVSHSQGVNRDLYRGRATQLVTARG